MPDPSGSPADRATAPYRPLPLWLLALAGIGLFLAGGILGAVLTVSITLYRAPAVAGTPAPASAIGLHESPTAVATTAPSPSPKPTATPAPTVISIGPAVGQEAPPFTLTGIDGITHTLATYRGRIVLVNFWASWCPPCRQEWPELRTFATEVAARNVVILAVNVEDPIEVIQEFVGDEESPFPVLLDSDGGVSERYRVAALPTTFLLDRSGIVLQVVPGNMDRSTLERLVDLGSAEP